MPMFDQIRIDIIRLVNRLYRLDIESFNLNTVEKISETGVAMMCGTCLEAVRPQNEYLAFECGHFFCAECTGKSVNKNVCFICRKTSVTAKFEIRFRFNNAENPVCRLCMYVLSDTKDILGNRCGCTFCTTCFDRLYDTCVCGKQMRCSTNYATRLFPAFE